MNSLGETISNNHIGDVNVSGDLDVEGTFEVGGISIAGNLDITGTLDVTGLTNLAALTTTGAINFADGINGCSADSLSVRIGSSAATTGGLGNVGIGSIAVATGSDGAIAIGRLSEATSNYSVGLGKLAKSNHSNSVAIGHQAITSATNQVILGGASCTSVALGSDAGLADLKCADITASGAITGASCTCTEQTPVAYTMSIASDSGTPTDVVVDTVVSYNGKWVFVSGIAEFKKGTMSGGLYFSVPKVAAADASGIVSYRVNYDTTFDIVIPKILAGQSAFDFYSWGSLSSRGTSGINIPATLTTIEFTLTYISV